MHTRKEKKKKQSYRGSWHKQPQQNCYDCYSVCMLLAACVELPTTFLRLATSRSWVGVFVAVLALAVIDAAISELAVAVVRVEPFASF